MHLPDPFYIRGGVDKRNGNSGFQVISTLNFRQERQPEERVPFHCISESLPLPQKSSITAFIQTDKESERETGTERERKSGREEKNEKKMKNGREEKRGEGERRERR